MSSLITSALRFHWLTRFYDPIMRVMLKEQRFKALLVTQASPRTGDRVLDFGCGTGTLTLMLKAACSSAQVVGLDGDPMVLTRARRKADKAGVAVDFQEGLATDPPFPPACFDKIVSSLLFHHLLPTDKQRSLCKAFEILKPAGELHVADWGRPHDPLMRAAFLAVQALDGFATTSDSVRGALPGYMEDVGFRSVSETHRVRTAFGSLAIYRGIKPQSEITTGFNATRYWRHRRAAVTTRHSSAPTASGPGRRGAGIRECPCVLTGLGKRDWRTADCDGRGGFYISSSSTMRALPPLFGNSLEGQEVCSWPTDCLAGRETRGAG